MCRVNVLFIDFFASMKIIYRDALVCFCVCDLTGFYNDRHQYYSLEK